MISVPDDIITEAKGGLTTVNIGHAMAYDASGILSLTNNAPEKFPLGMSTIIWTAIDGSGNMTIAPQTITVNDSTSPEISAIPKIRGEAKSLTQNTIDLGIPSVHDLVGIGSVENDAPEVFPLGETIVTWTVSDIMGNTSTAEQIVELFDNINPRIAPPENLVIEAISLTENQVDLMLPDVQDNLGIKSLSNNAPEFFPLGETIVTWTATDESGNSVSNTQLVSVVDTTSPVVIVQDIILEATTSDGINAKINLPEIDDLQQVSFTNDAPELFPLGETIVTWTATDDSGNQSTTTQLISVVDTTSPVIQIPDNIIFEATGLTSIIEDLGTTIHSDISGISSITNNAPEVFPLGETIVTWTVVDNYGNVSDGTQIITVVDTTAPELIVPSNIISEAISTFENTINLNSPRVADNVEILSITNDAPEFFPLGETIVTWTATDDSGNISTDIQKIKFVDTTSPLLIAPNDISIELDDRSGMIIEIGNPTMIDEIDTNPQITNDAPEFFPLGETIVTWTATDDSGNQSTTTQLISVVDTTSPEFVTLSNILLEAQNASSNLVEFDIPSVYDLVGVSSITNDAPEFFPLGETIVTWTATDESGNQSTMLQNVTFVDTTNPQIQTPEHVSVEAISKYENSIVLETAIAFDSVGVSSITNDAPEFFPLGETIVTWTATDESGNSVSNTQLVSVVDTTSPEIQLPNSISIEADTSQNNIVELGMILADDLVGVSSITNDAPEFFPLGETIVTWTATDESGNSSSVMQLILISDTTLPTIVSPIDVEFEATSKDQNIIDLGIPDVFDSVGLANVTNDAPEFFPLGETIVTWTATDESGNTALDTQTIRLVDTIAPIITQPLQVIVDATSVSSTIIELSPPQVFDSVSDVRLESDTNNSFEFGETIVTWTATDESGNFSSITQSVMIIDESAPTLDIPSNIILDATSLENIIEIGNANVSDFVDDNPIITNDAPEFFPLGETIVTWTATDESGNFSSSTQNILVQACGKTPSYYNLILGSNDDDLLIGTNMPDLIFSFYGDDIISASNGNDCILAGEGDDIIFGNEGNDNISGGPGNDIMKGQSGADILRGGFGLDIADGGDGTDVYKNVTESNNDLVLNCETNE